MPGQPLHDNAAYIDRARQLEKDLESALIDELDQARPRDQAAE